MIFYVYLGYPLLIGVIGKIRNRRINKLGIEPEVTILIAAYNEEENIGSTLKNKLELGYPKDKLEIIVISDGSTDNTDEIVKRYESEKVRLIRQEPRAGKTSALNLAVPEAMGQIVLFSDANSLWDPHALRSLVANFADPEVGYVTGKMIYVNPDGNPTGDGCTAYMRYENFLRRARNPRRLGCRGGWRHRCRSKRTLPAYESGSIAGLCFANEGYRSRLPSGLRAKSHTKGGDAEGCFRRIPDASACRTSFVLGPPRHASPAHLHAFLIYFK